MNEGLIAHETAHQWFGDAVTEKLWPHVWLSEGFATYFANLFFEHADGVARLRSPFTIWPAMQTLGRAVDAAMRDKKLSR